MPPQQLSTVRAELMVSFLLRPRMECATASTSTTAITSPGDDQPFYRTRLLTPTFSCAHLKRRLTTHRGIMSTIRRNSTPGQNNDPTTPHLPIRCESTR